MRVKGVSMQDLPFVCLVNIDYGFLVGVVIASVGWWYN